MKNCVFSADRPSCVLASWTSFSSSRTAYSSVVLVSSTSSTINTFFPIRFAISRLLRSSHCVLVTLVPGSSSGPSVPSFSYSDRPMAWMGMFGLPGFFRKDLCGIRLAALTTAHEAEDEPEYAGGNVTSATDGDHEIRLEFMEDAVGRLLAQFVHLALFVSLTAP
jgi:hypothetical protein